MHKGLLAAGMILSLVLAAAGCSNGDHNAAPTAPSNFSALADNATCVTLAWDASTDDVWVAGYHVYRDNVLVGTTQTPGFSDNALVPDTEYRFAVSAFDAEGGESARCTELAARTKAAAWIRTFAEAGYAYSAVQAADNGFIVAGTEFTTALGYEMSVGKTDILGGDVWRATFGGAGATTSDLLMSMAKTSDGGFLVTGYWLEPAGFPNPGSPHPIVLKTDSLGNTE